MRAFQNSKSSRRENGRQNRSFSYPKKRKTRLFRVHPLFWLVGVWYAFTGELFLFFLSALVAIQHELAHAYAAAKLGYKLNRVVLMPFGAVIDGDLRGISLKDEIIVALCGPLCNFITAVFFVALWWFVPTMYAFTDVAFHSSLAIAIVNLLPAYPLDGGRILKCSLAKMLSKKHADVTLAEEKAEKFCRFLTLAFSLCLSGFFLVSCVQKNPNFSLLVFSVFLFAGFLGNKDKAAFYARIDFAQNQPLKRGIEIRRVAVLASCPVKDVFRFLSRGSYLVLEIYDEKERHLCNLPQNKLAALFEKAPSPYTPIREMVEKDVYLP